MLLFFLLMVHACVLKQTTFGFEIDHIEYKCINFYSIVLIQYLYVEQIHVHLSFDRINVNTDKRLHKSFDTK